MVHVKLELKRLVVFNSDNKDFLPPATKKPSCLQAMSTSVKPTSSIMRTCLQIVFVVFKGE